MNSRDAGSWYLAFTVGAVCVFAVVVAVAVVLQLVSRVGRQLAEVAETLTVIRTSTAALPAVAAINADVREMNHILAGARRRLHRLVPRSRP